MKPDPPERVVATPIPSNVRRLEVSWTSPSSWPEVDSFPLKYFLRYRPLIKDQWQHVSGSVLIPLLLLPYGRAPFNHMHRSWVLFGATS